MNFRFMRLLLFFDLPVETSKNKKEYRHFVRDIKKEGFFMMQKSVYVKMAVDSKSGRQTINRINKLTPDEGSVIILSVTEHQFQNIDILLGEFKTNMIDSKDRIIEL